MWFSQGLCPIQFEVFVHHRRMRHRFLLMEWALVPFRGSPVSFVPLLHQCTIQAGQHCRSKCLELCLCLSLSSGSVQSTSLFHERYQPTGAKTLVRQQPEFPFLMGCVSIFFNNSVLPSVAREKSIILKSRKLLELFKYFHGAPLANNSDDTHSWNWWIHLLVSDVYLVLCLPVI